jgi:GDP-D-mannose 3',5'-epimerase
MEPAEFCDEFLKLDLRILENCLIATKGCQHVYNLAADMGGMGFIVSNQSVLLYNNTMISFNMLEAARQNAAKRYFYSSTACVYNEALQTDPANPGLREDMAWPARPQDTYGLEKLYGELTSLLPCQILCLSVSLSLCFPSGHMSQTLSRKEVIIVIR